MQTECTIVEFCDSPQVVPLGTDLSMGKFTPTYLPPVEHPSVWRVDSFIVPHAARATRVLWKPVANEGIFAINC